MPDHPRLTPRLRLKLDQDIALGPGKAQLLEAIADSHSISAAAKHLGMSYRRAWLLVDTMNQCFRNPLVQTATGGRQGGGAELSELGHHVLGLYRRYEQRLLNCPELGELEQLIQPGSSDTLHKTQTE
ncbi:winged helix-turn-helix domain-containing protein [Marinobacter mobilis]|uniref:Molybdate transport system regulatory protein n=1 Tax=Marinobacter mobilis TaxID=488533 RepID=A0A1H2Q7W0_9GAMM|nr:winged helix-turn-helix domain-containing protein [Marinobacter mobilis]SDW03222.1 molybdate transport system regulatory protein [Marinobacter mobilis]